MKKILIVICDMKIGGAQRSLLSFLQEFCAQGEAENTEIHLLPLNPVGEYMEQIPEGVRLLTPDHTLRWLGSRMNMKLLAVWFSLRGLAGELLWLGRKALGLHRKELNIQQRVWENWRGLISARKESYDAAIAYIDGIPAYYVMDKVKAKKKVLWLHSDYRMQAYDPDYDRTYYARCDAAVTVSEECRETLCQAFPEYREKTCVLENISSGSILQKSLDGVCPEYADTKGWKLLSVGRLHVQKGMDIAIQAAERLARRGVDFTWLIVGEGSERANLEAMIREKALTARVKLIGSRENPYKYMRECDILVQTSRVEGKSIVLDEAKMLGKPAVVTHYPTVSDAIAQEETGLIVETEPDAIAEGIIRMMQDETLRIRIEENLRHLPKGNEKELRRYIEILF